jgi:hypothetical protein
MQACDCWQVFKHSPSAMPEHHLQIEHNLRIHLSKATWMRTSRAASIARLMVGDPENSPCPVSACLWTFRIGFPINLLCFGF